VTITKGNLKQAIIDSCGLPVLFKSFGNFDRNSNVDGGLCNNLPVSCLLDDNSAPIFAVYPADNSPDQHPDTLPRYLLAMLSASIDDNVAKSKAIVDNAFHIPVKVSYNTFDFNKAIDLYSNGLWYDKEYGRVKTKISEFVRVGGLSNTAISRRYISTINIKDYADFIYRMAGSHRSLVTLVRSTLTVRVRCAIRANAGAIITNREPDVITHAMKLRVESEHLRYFSQWFSTSASEFEPSVWSARNVSQNKDIPIELLPAGRSPQKVAVGIVEFINPKENLKVGDIIEIYCNTYSLDGMVSLNVGTPDFIQLNKLDADGADAYIFCIIPTSLGKFKFHISPENTVKESVNVTICDTEYDSDRYHYKLKAELAAASKLNTVRIEIIKDE
jgi:hypothetical protein